MDFEHQMLNNLYSNNIDKKVFSNELLAQQPILLLMVL